MDVIEAGEQRILELYEELGRRNPDDPAYKIICEEINSLTKSLVMNRQTELKRLNNNARMDLAETGLLIQNEKVKNDRRKNRLEWGGKILYGILIVGTGWLSYEQDMLKVPKKAWVWAKENILRKF